MFSTSNAISVLNRASDALGMRLEYDGDLSLLNFPRRALLVSRDTRNPTPGQQWILQISAAVRQIAAREEVLVSSAGTIAYDAALFSCFINSGCAIVVLQVPPTANDLWRSWLPRNHLLVYPAQAARVKSTHASSRDLLVGWLANCAHEIFVRPNGNMASVASLLRERGCPVDVDFKCEPKNTARPPKGAITADTTIRLDPSTWNYLTHFTREPDGAWPDESRHDYLHWLCSGERASLRDAFAALCRILNQRRVIACGRLMPDRAPMVCFTALPPGEAKKLNTWRRGLRRWSFTPFGLAIRKEALTEIGVREVRYMAETEINMAPREERRFMQRERSGNMEWSRETEWRMAGDLDLSQFKPDQLLALVETPDQVRHVAAEYGIDSRLT